MSLRRFTRRLWGQLRAWWLNEPCRSMKWILWGPTWSRALWRRWMKKMAPWLSNLRQRAQVGLDFEWFCFVLFLFLLFFSSSLPLFTFFFSFFLLFLFSSPSLSFFPFLPSPFLLFPHLGRSFLHSSLLARRSNLPGLLRSRSVGVKREKEEEKEEKEKKKKRKEEKTRKGKKKNQKEEKGKEKEGNFLFLSFSPFPFHQKSLLPSPFHLNSLFSSYFAPFLLVFDWFLLISLQLPSCHSNEEERRRKEKQTNERKGEKWGRDKGQLYRLA